MQYLTHIKQTVSACRKSLHAGSTNFRFINGHRYVNNYLIYNIVLSNVNKTFDVCIIEYKIKNIYSMITQLLLNIRELHQFDP